MGDDIHQHFIKGVGKAKSVYFPSGPVPRI